MRRMHAPAAAAICVFAVLQSNPAETPLTPEEARGAYVREFRRHRLEEAARILAEDADRIPEAARGALDLDRALLEEVRAALADLSRFVAAGQRFPGTLGKTSRVRGDVVASDAEGFTIRDSKGEKRLRWSDLDWRDVADFLAAREPSDPRRLRVAGALRVLDADLEKGWKALAQVRDAAGSGGEARLAGNLLEARASIEAGHREAKAMEALGAVPAEAAGEALLEAVRRALADAEVVETTTYRRGRASLAPRVSKALEEAFDRGGVRELFRGAAEVGEAGAFTLRYAFDRPEQIEDWDLAPYPAIDYGPWQDLPKEADPARLQPWTVKEGVLSGAGHPSARHVARFLGDISLEFSLRMAALDKGPKGETVMCIFLAGILDDGKGAFIASQNLRGLVRINRLGIVRLGEPLPDAPHLAFGKNYPARLEWKEKKVRAFIGDKLCHEAPVGDATGGGVFLWASGPVSVRVDDLVIRGTLDPAWVASGKASWLAKRLAAELPEPPK